MGQLVQIPGTNLVRDTESRALINRDIVGLQEYQVKRNLVANQKQEINSVKNEIKDIRDEMGEIKSLLLQLLGKSNG